MASPKLPNYLKTHRKRLGLSQDEVAYLLGVESAAKVCRYERFLRDPSFETLLALKIIFQRPADDLFGGSYQKIDLEVRKRARQLIQKLSKDKQSPSRDRKLQTLKAIISKSKKP